ncbi:MAG: AgmX/PglI C-terminal domain-containing protein [Myxococcaceae bacterium]
MRLVLLLVAVPLVALADKTDKVNLLRTDDGGTPDGGPTFNGFALDKAVHAKGSLSKDDIKKGVEAHRGEVEACYAELVKRVKKGAPPKGTAKLKFEVAPDGLVADAEVSGPGFEEAAFVGCVTGKVKKWKFAEPQGGGYVKVSFPVQLEPE